jgi:hypothetical protein
MPVTGGKISFSRTVRPADFESKSSTVELSFVLDDGDTLETVLSDLGKVAQAKALELVGLKIKG